MKRNIFLLCWLCTMLSSPAMAATGETTVSGTVPLVAYDVTASNIGYYRATIS